MTGAIWSAPFGLGQRDLVAYVLGLERGGIEPLARLEPQRAEPRQVARIGQGLGIARRERKTRQRRKLRVGGESPTDTPEGHGAGPAHRGRRSDFKRPQVS